MTDRQLDRQYRQTQRQAVTDRKTEQGDSGNELEKVRVGKAESETVTARQRDDKTAKRRHTG